MMLEGERKKERESATSQCHAQQALTPSVTHNGGKGKNVYCKRKKSKWQFYIRLVHKTNLFNFLLHIVKSFLRS